METLTLLPAAGEVGSFEGQFSTWNWLLCNWLIVFALIQVVMKLDAMALVAWILVYVIPVA